MSVVANRQHNKIAWDSSRVDGAVGLIDGYRMGFDGYFANVSDGVAYEN
jgi:hypothetical protein